MPATTRSNTLANTPADPSAGALLNQPRHVTEERSGGIGADRAGSVVDSTPGEEQRPTAVEPQPTATPQRNPFSEFGTKVAGIFAKKIEDMSKAARAVRAALGWK